MRSEGQSIAPNADSPLHEALQVLTGVDLLEDRVREVHPETVLLLIEPQNAAAFARAHVPRLGGR